MFADLVKTFIPDISGSVIIGVILGFIDFKLLDFIDNEQSGLEILVTVALLTVSTQLTHWEAIEVSGKQASVVMGLAAGNQGKSDKLAGVAGDYVFKF